MKSLNPSVQQYMEPAGEQPCHKAYVSQAETMGSSPLSFKAFWFIFLNSGSPNSHTVWDIQVTR